MNHRLKTFAFKSLAVLPDYVGMRVYHLLQNFSENKNLAQKIRSTENTYNTLIEICEKLSIRLQGKKVIEIGSGWLPMIPYFFVYKSKVSCVHTYDLNTHYQKRNISNINNIFNNTYGYGIVPEIGNRYNLPKEVRYHNSENLIYATLPPAEIVFSRFVLEHVTPEDMFEMHKKFKRSLTKGTYIIHFISPSDHRAYSDKTLSLQDFLKYSQQEWDSIQTNFDYHNRMRLPQYLKLFEESGLELISVAYDNPKQGSSQLEAFRSLKIHDDYSIFPEEQLTAGSINIVLKV